MKACLPVNFLLYDEKRDFGDVEVSHQLLRFLVRLDWSHVEQDELLRHFCELAPEVHRHFSLDIVG